MSRTPAGGRLPHGPRHVVTAAAAVGIVLLSACSTPAPPRAASPASGTTPTARSSAGAPAGTLTRTPTTPRVSTPTATPRTTPPGAPTTRADIQDHAHPSAPVTRRRVPPPPAKVPPPGARRLTGVLTRVAVERSPQHEGGIRTYVRTADGPVELPEDDLDHLPTGSRVVADVGGDRLLAAASVAGPAPRRAPTAAVHEVVTALVLPPGARPDASTPEGLAATVDGAVSRYWSAQTGGRVRFTVSRSAGWLPVRSSCADAWGLWAEVAVKVGFVPAPRRHLVVLVPKSQQGCYAGLGTIGASVQEGGYAYVRGTLPGLVAHELGHNLGLGHSNGLQCGSTADATFSAGTWAARCVRTAYRDWYDVMGVSWDRLGTLSTAQAYRLGVLGPDDVTTVSGPARVTLTAVSLHAGLRSLRVRTATGAVYTVEYRPASGADAWLADNWRGLRPGVLVRRDDPASESGETLLLDASPAQSSPAFADDWDTALAVGGTVAVAGGRVVVHVEDATATTATVSVQVDGRLPASGPDGDLTRLGARRADGTSNRVVREPVAATPTPGGRRPERLRGPVHTPSR